MTINFVCVCVAKQLDARDEINRKANDWTKTQILLLQLMTRYVNSLCRWRFTCFLLVSLFEKNVDNFLLEWSDEIKYFWSINCVLITSSSSHHTQMIIDFDYTIDSLSREIFPNEYSIDTFCHTIIIQLKAIQRKESEQVSKDVIMNNYSNTKLILIVVEKTFFCSFRD